LRILLDTHCWLWMAVDPERLSTSTQELLRDGENELLFSAVSSWEIAIKYSQGRLPLPNEPADLIPELLAQSGTHSLPIQHHHTLQVAKLPPHHRDPFDRLLIAQAQVERIPILTADRQFARYDVELIPA
jgi:PIN domain nuclease of toxin-antitoxin system